jgi:Uncharacterized conserved protein
VDFKEFLRDVKEKGLLKDLVMELLRDDESYMELSRYFVVFGNGLFLRPIGVVRHGYGDDFVRRSLTGVEGVVEVFEEYMDGLRGVDGFSHLILISLLHNVTREQREVLVVRPRRLAMFGVKPSELTEVGVFATDSPHRPNPVGSGSWALGTALWLLIRGISQDLDSGVLLSGATRYTEG